MNVLLLRRFAVSPLALVAWMWQDDLRDGWQEELSPGTAAEAAWALFLWPLPPPCSVQETGSPRGPGCSHGIAVETSGVRVVTADLKELSVIGWSPCSGPSDDPRIFLQHFLQLLTLNLKIILGSLP